MSTAAYNADIAAPAEQCEYFVAYEACDETHWLRMWHHAIFGSCFSYFVGGLRSSEDTGAPAPFEWGCG